MIAELVAGLALGLSVAMPFGPVSLVCVRHSLASGWRGGLLAGAGASTAHGAFAFAAIAGAGALAPTLADWGGAIHMMSGALLVALGLRTLLRRARSATSDQPGGARTTYLSSLLLALSNPLTLLPYLAVASSAAASDGQGPYSYWSMLGVIAGAAVWYGVLTLTTALLRSGLPPSVLPRLNLISGTMLVAFGLVLGLR